MESSGKRTWRGMNGFSRFRGGPGLTTGLGKRRQRGMNGFGTFRGGPRIKVKILQNEIKLKHGGCTPGKRWVSLRAVYPFQGVSLLPQ